MSEQSETPQGDPNSVSPEKTPEVVDPSVKLNQATAELEAARKDLAQKAGREGASYVVDVKHPQIQSTPDANGGTTTNGGVTFEKPVSLLDRVKNALLGK